MQNRKTGYYRSKVFEDNLDGKISDERFARMSATYDAEQK